MILVSIAIVGGFQLPKVSCSVILLGWPMRTIDVEITCLFLVSYGVSKFYMGKLYFKKKRDFSALC